MPSKKGQAERNKRKRAKLTSYIDRAKALDARVAARSSKHEKIKADLAVVRSLAELQATHFEIAAALRVNQSTFTARLHADPAYQEAYDQGKANGMKTLRRLQLKSAKRGNVVMQIWLGKNTLEQKDKTTVEQTGKDGGPIEVIHTFESNI